MNISANVSALHEEISDLCAQSGRSVDEITLIAVTKTQEPSVLPALAAAGITDFGENRLEHLELMQNQADDAWTFHGIGRVQSRQLPKWAQRCGIMHSIHEQKHLKRLDNACAELQKQMPIFIQVNTSGEAVKAGCEPEQLDSFLEEAACLGSLNVVGLMCMAPKREADGSVDADIRRAFESLRNLAQKHNLERLSMGMSGDFDLAIAAGATDIRIGTRLFV